MPASPLLRHQSSCELILDFSEKPSLDDDERNDAQRRFYKITVYFESKHSATHARSITTFNRPGLVKLTYEYSRNQASKDGFLYVFFETMELPMRGDISTIDLSDPVVESDLGKKVADFGDYLMTNFYLPLKANMGKTPQITPATDSAIAKLQGGHEFTSTTGRLATLRRDCLVRDRHRCVITRDFDYDESQDRTELYGDNAADDDGVVFGSDPNLEPGYSMLQVAHIMPHALVESEKKKDEATLDPTRKAAMSILNMFDQGVSHMLNSVDIDRPRNAMSMTANMHNAFGKFHIFFTAVDGQEHTYDIQTFRKSTFFRRLPARRTLFLTPERTIEPPSPRLLGIHRAIAHILHLTGAGAYIERVLRDLEETAVRADGTTPLGSLVNMGLRGLLPAKANA